MSETIFSGRRPRPGTKAHLLSTLRTAGFDPDIIDLVLTKGGQVPQDLSVRASPRLDDTLGVLRAQFPSATYASSSEDRDAVLWDTYGRHPFWLANQSGFLLTLIANNWRRAQRMSASLVVDLYSTLGEEPQERMPQIGRFSIATWSGAQGVQAFLEQKAPTTDLAIMSAHYTTSDNLFSVLEACQAIAQSMRGLVVVEMVGEEDAVKKLVRTGIRPIFGMLKEST